MCVFAAVGALVVPAAPVDAAGPVDVEIAEPDTVRVLVEVGPTSGASRAEVVEAAVGDVDVVDEFATSDYVVADVAPDLVDQLAASPGVTDLVVDQSATRALDGSVPLVNAPAQWSDGHTGSGTTVAIVDDGVLAIHPNLAGKVQAEACFAGLTGCAGSPTATGPGSAQPCAGCTHGTHVAGIAAGAGGGRDGVAPDAGIFSVRVFAASSGSAFFSDIALGLEHVLARAGEFDIAAVNLSIQGPTPFVGTCDGENPPLTAAVHALIASGIPVVVASGNAGNANGMPLPACISGVISVGSHTDGLTVASTSNANAFTSIVAPGVDIDSPHPPSGFSSVSGTSFAAPHVAGALAIWLERFPGINDEIGLYLSANHGRTILDGRNGRTYPRLFLDDPASVLLGGLFAPSTERVSGSYQPVTGDFDGDATDDIFWYAPGGAPDYVWTSTDRSEFTSRFEPVQGTYEVAVADQNGDGRDDLFLHGPGSQTDHLWFGRSDGKFDKTTLSVPGDHRLLVGDFTADGVDDIFLYQAGSAPDGLLVGGPTVTIQPSQILGTYVPLVGDYDGDSTDDIFWYAAGSRPDYVWYGGSAGFTSVARSVGGTYEPFVGDFGGDGLDDVFWYRPGTGPDYVWRGVGDRGPFTSTPTSVLGSYAPSAFDAPGGSDGILWYSTTGGADYLWAFVGSGVNSTSVDAGNGGEVLTGRFDALGGDDLFFYRPGAAIEQVWHSIAESTQ